MTLQTQMVLQAFLAAPAKELYGRQIADLTGLRPGTTQPILARIEVAGWLMSRRENLQSARAEGRPPRRYFNLTTDGEKKARAALANARRPHAEALRELSGLQDATNPSTTLQDGTTLSLTAEEAALLSMLGEDPSVHRIAVRLAVNDRTAEQYIGRLYRKLDVSTRNQAVSRGLHLGLLKPRQFEGN